MPALFTLFLSFSAQEFRANPSYYSNIHGHNDNQEIKKLPSFNLRLIKVVSFHPGTEEAHPLVITDVNSSLGMSYGGNCIGVYGFI